MFCLRGSSQRVVEPVPVTSETKVQKPSLGDINLNHEIFRRKSMIANPNVQLVKIKTVVAFRNARNGGGSEGAENNDRLPSLGGTNDKSTTGGFEQPTTNIKGQAEIHLGGRGENSDQWPDKKGFVSRI